MPSLFILLAAQGNSPYVIPFDPVKIIPLPEKIDSAAPARKKVEIISTDELQQITDTINGILFRRLKGNVKLRHDGAIMTCDSATLFPDANYLEASGRVFIKKGDSLDIRSKELKYYGDSKYALLEKNVVLRDKTTVLETPQLDYDVEKDIGNFYNEGKLTTDSTVVTSKTGTYYQQTKDAIFKGKVVLTHPDYTMFADSMKYNTQTKIAYFIGPTTILQDKDTIVTNSGFFDTQKNKAYFGDRPIIKKENSTLQSNTLDYDKKAGIGTATGDVVYKNPEEKVILLSGKTEYADSNSYVRSTNDPLMIQEDEKDTLYLSADTLISLKEYFIKDTLSAEKDSFKITYGYRDVRLIRSKMSGVCDSLYYSAQDSTFRLFYNPILWMDSTQLSADTIFIYMQNKEVYKVELRSNALIIMEKDLEIYNQIKGRQVTAFLEKEKLKKVFVDGNAESIYFIQDDSSAYIGGNQSKSSEIEASFKEGEIIEIKLDLQPEAVFTPMQLIDPVSFRLEGFSWQFNRKPKSKWDVIRDSVQYRKYLFEQNKDVVADSLIVKDSINIEKTEEIPLQIPEKPRVLPTPQVPVTPLPKQEKPVKVSPKRKFQQPGKNQPRKT